MQTTWTSPSLTFSYVTLEDLTPISEMLTKETVCRWLFFGPNLPEVTHAYFLPFLDENALALAEDRLPSNFVFTIRNRKTKAFIGQCALIADEFSPGAYLVGYQIDDPFWNKGIGSEAVTFLIWFAFRIAGAYRLNADTAAGNQGSARVLEKGGFVPEGRQRKYWHARGGYHDRLLFGLLTEEVKEDVLATLDRLFS
ncbi:GNAT family N-acetyltransferase [Methanogenium marinum]|uniref:GNAT family N-acetyltransferase n=1 Tax=Methanogenium marinum TaxID=348610 RepID=A0A9Q4KTJ1_9EURY|nr:GNAT family protein [Methanogenium marinum]MDE4908537.1 GNAT family N-acetyltransferase [Methanogenium marinum]